MNNNIIKKRILYVGPLGFRPGVWETRATYIFPDLFDAVPEQFEIHMLTGIVPRFAKKSLEKLCRCYDITHSEIRPRQQNISLFEYWEKEISFTANQIKPDIITNIFGAVTLGTPMGVVGKKIRARTILRVAGDEIGTRNFMGIYDRKIEKLDVDLTYQTLGIQMADTIIVMSPLEKERICKDLPESQWKKVLVCIRGIDISHFPKIEKNYRSEQVKRFLFVGRKSVEKGYDILEDVADTIFKVNKHIQFVFAGSFEPLKIKNRDYIGWVDSNNLYKSFSESDVFIMTSRTEGFPQVVSEAMATGLPCILPKHIFENIFKHTQEVLLTSLNPKEISAAILQLHEDKELATSLSDAGRKFAETNLDRKVWAKIYHSILSGKEKSINDPFSCFKKVKSEKAKMVPGKINRTQLKIILLISPEMSSIVNVRHKINRLIIEMIKRKHLIYLVFPGDESISFSTSEDVIFLPHKSLQNVKEQIQKLTPDLLIMIANDREQLKYYSIVQGIDIPLVILKLLLHFNICDDKGKKYQPTFDSAIAAWKEEIAFSSAALVLTEDKNSTNYMPKILQNRIVPYPKIGLKKNKTTEADLEIKVEKNMKAFFPIYNLTIQSFESVMKKVFDQIETLFFGVSDYKNNPKRLLRGQIDIDSERALHARRMRNKFLQQYKRESSKFSVGNCSPRNGVFAFFAKLM